MSHSVQEVHASPNFPMFVPNTNEVGPSPTAGKLKLRVKPKCLVKSSIQLPPSVKWTCSGRKKKQERLRILKENCDKLVIIDLYLREEPSVEALSGEVEKGNQQVMEGANTLISMALSLSPILQTPLPKENPFIPNWFDLSISKKSSIVPTTLLVGDMVGKYLRNTPKDKKEKI